MVFGGDDIVLNDVLGALGGLGGVLEVVGCWGCWGRFNWCWGGLEGGDGAFGGRLWGVGGVWVCWGHFGV